MKKIVIYSSLVCPYCTAAKSLLKDQGLNFEEILVDGNPEVKQEMINKSNGKTSVPQIFFDDNLIGGFDELNRLKQKCLLKKKIE